MARITVEDCVLRVPNRFDLVMLASQRARDVSAGAPLLVDRDNDKNPVVALREIAEDKLDLDHLRYELIHGLRRHVAVEDRPDDELLTALQEHPMVAPEAEAEDIEAEDIEAEDSAAEDSEVEDSENERDEDEMAEPAGPDPAEEPESLR